MNDREELRLPPHDIASEEQFLGACLADSSVPPRVIGLLRPRDFFREKNAWVFEAITSLVRKGQPITPLTVSGELERSHRLEPIGGYPYVYGLLVNLATVVGVEYSAERIRATAAFTRLIGISGRLAQSAYEAQGNPLDLVSTHLTELRGEMAGHGAGMSSLHDLIDERWDELLAWASAPAEHSGAISTGLQALDAILLGGGLQRGKLYIIGGATSMGKSSLMRWVLKNIAVAGYPVALLSLEQDRDEVIRELAFSHAGINQQWHEMTGTPLDEDTEARFTESLVTLAALPYWVDDEPALTPGRAQAKLESLRSAHPELAVVGMDYAQIFKAEGRHGRDDERLAEIVETIRDLAKRMGVAVLLGSQLIKEADDARLNADFRPKLRLFRGSGALTYLAFAVLGLFRPDWLFEKGLVTVENAPEERIEILAGGKRKYRPSHELEIHVLKQQRGPSGVARVRFDTRTRQIADVTGAEVNG